MSEPWEYEVEAAYDHFLEESLRSISKDSVLYYLKKYGIEKEKRVRECIEQAKQLNKLNFYGPSLTLSITAIELTIRFLLLRPLTQGAFLSDEWAEILSERIASGRSLEDRKLLPAILKQWGVDITTIKLSSKESFWGTLTFLHEKRNGFVHKGEPVKGDDAIAGNECAVVILEQIFYPIAKKLRFTY